MTSLNHKHLFDRGKFNEILPPKNDFSLDPKEVVYLTYALEKTGSASLAYNYLHSYIEQIHKQNIDIHPELNIAKAYLQWRQGHLEKAIATIQQLQSELRDIGSSKEIYAEIFKIQGLIHWTQSDFQLSEENFNRSKIYYEDLEDLYGTAEIINHLGEVFRYRGMLDEAFDCYLKSHKIALENDFLALLANVKRNFGIYYDKKEDRDRSIKHYQQCVDISTEINYKQGIHRGYHGLGVLELNAGNYDQAIAYVKNGKKLREEIDDFYDLGVSNLVLGVIYENLGALEKAMNYNFTALTIFEKLGNLLLISSTLQNIGIIYSHMGDSPKELEYYLKCLEIKKQIGNEIDIAYTNNHIADYYLGIGDLEHALNIYLPNLELFKKSNETSIILGVTMGNVGRVYSRKGLIDKADEYLTHCLEYFKKIDHKLFIATANHNMAIMSLYRGFFDESKKRALTALSIRRELGNDIQTSQTLFFLLGFHLIKGETDRNQEIVKELKEINDRNKNKLLSIYSELGKAVLLKTHNRMYEKSEAQNIFNKIRALPDLDYNIMVFSSLHLCDILVDEYSVYGQNEVLDEIKSILDNIHQLAEKQLSVLLSVELIILKSKLSVIQGELGKSLEYLAKATTLVNENKLDYLKVKLKTEKDKVVSSYGKWESIIERNLPVKVIVDETRIKDYIIEASKIFIESEFSQ